MALRYICVTGRPRIHHTHCCRHRVQVYQTGDLANMDGLPEDSKRLLPSLFAIRDGLYSLEFRRLVQSLTGSGPLSGQQIDLSANAFGHTGHLLCHDDVIGTRKACVCPRLRGRGCRG